MAYASMREFDRALSDLTHACELDPHNAEDRYERGVIYAGNHQLKSAVEDFDAAIALKPDDMNAHLARAEVLQLQPGTDSAVVRAEIESDLATVSRLVAPAAGVRLTLSDLYGKLGDYPAGLDQINQWLSHHPLDTDQAQGLNSRCWLRATANRDLHEALDDCNRALALRPRAQEETESRIRTTQATAADADFLDSRGLVYLRLGNLKDAIDDYDSALEDNARMPSSLYGRGLAELRLGEKAQGQKDLTTAEQLEPGVTKIFASMGLTP